MVFTHKKLFLSLLAVSATTLSAGTFAAGANYQKIDKELRIMSRIFETSMEESSRQKIKLPGSRKPAARYLAKQGMVFEFNFGSSHVFYDNDGWQALGAGIGNLVGSIANEVGAALQDVDVNGVTPTAPVAPVAPSTPLSDQWADDFSEQFEERMHAYEQRMEELEQMREAQRDQREKVRDLQREIRDLERARRNAEEDDRKVEQLRKELKEKQTTLNEKMKRYQQQMDAYRKKRDEDYLKSAQKKSDTILATLCDYGSTLRSLENDEFVTLIFSKYQGGKDQIYVFKSADVKDCDSPKELLSDAVKYQL